MLREKTEGYLRDLWQDKWLLVLISLKFVVAGFFVVELIQLDSGLNEAGCRFAVEQVSKNGSELGGVLQ